MINDLSITSLKAKPSIKIPACIPQASFQIRYKHFGSALCSRHILQARGSKVTPTAHSAIHSHYPTVMHCLNTSIHRVVAEVAELAYTSVQLPGNKSKCHSNHLPAALFRATKLSVTQVCHEGETRPCTESTGLGVLDPEK